MKTFDEAAKTFQTLAVDVVDGQDVVEAIAAARARVADFVGRRRELLQEANRSEVVKEMVEGHFSRITGTADIEDNGEALGEALRTGLFSMFMNGLVIGMEMEKQEL